MDLRKERLQTLHLGVGQPIKIAHRSGFLQGLNHAKLPKSTGLELRGTSETRGSFRSGHLQSRVRPTQEALMTLGVADNCEVIAVISSELTAVLISIATTST